MWIETTSKRPADNQKIFYYFEPFGSYHFGVYDAESDSVVGRSGFTTMIPEVPYWMEVPQLPLKSNKQSITPGRYKYTRSPDCKYLPPDASGWCVDEVEVVEDISSVTGDTIIIADSDSWYTYFPPEILGGTWEKITE